MPKLSKVYANEMNFGAHKLKRLENNLLYLNIFTLTKNFNMKKSNRSLTNVKVYNSRLSKIVAVAYLITLSTRSQYIARSFEKKVNWNEHNWKANKMPVFYEMCPQIMHSCPRRLEWALANFFFSYIFHLS